MQEAMINVLIKAVPHSEANTLVEEIRQIEGCNRAIQIPSAAFSGREIHEMLVVLSSSGSIVSLAKVLSTWISANRGRTVKLGDKEIKGYSVDQIVKILEALQRGAISNENKSD